MKVPYMTQVHSAEPQVWEIVFGHRFRLEEGTVPFESKGSNSTEVQKRWKRSNVTIWASC
jgi:hypothetical protein